LSLKADSESMCYYWSVSQIDKDSLVIQEGLLVCLIGRRDMTQMSNDKIKIRVTTRKVKKKPFTGNAQIFIFYCYGFSSGAFSDGCSHLSVILAGCCTLLPIAYLIFKSKPY
jgi:uncharacterized membrane protein YfcA